MTLANVMLGNIVFFLVFLQKYNSLVFFYFIFFFEVYSWTCTRDSGQTFHKYIKSSMADNNMALELYRGSNLGVSLMDTIDELVTEGKISPI